MNHYAQIASLPLRVEAVRLRGLEQTTASGFHRLSTVVVLEGGGCRGTGEDVSYGTSEQEALRRAGPPAGLQGTWTVAEFGQHIASLDLFPGGTSQDSYRLYRRWAFESAALDLALAQAGTDLASVLGRRRTAPTFVVSMSLPKGRGVEPIRRWLEVDPDLQFKVDASLDWDDALIQALVETASIRIVDLKGQYSGTAVDTPADADLYARIASGLTEVVLEDPAWTPATSAVLAPYRERISYDAPIHSVADLDRLPLEPRWLNIKPSRSGSWEALFALYAWAEEHRVTLYGGGQFELGPGRLQAQELASLFHPTGWNDLAPPEFNHGAPRPGLPRSPLPPLPAFGAGLGSGFGSGR